MTGRLLRVYGWLADHGGCGHYRIIQPLRELNEQGLAYCRWGTKVTYGEMREYDVIVGQRVSAAEPSRLWRRLATDGRHLLVYEIDDDLWNVDHGNPTHGYYSHPETLRRMSTNVSLAGLVTVTTEPLAERVARINPRVVVLPNWIDRLLLDIPRPASADRPGLRVGWAGSGTHREDIRSVREPLWRALRRMDARVVFFGTDYSEGLPDEKVEIWPWVRNFERYYRQLAGFDVGLAPLKPTRFNTAKSDLRAKELHALGIPAVYTGGYPYGPTVADGETGLVASRASEWPKLVRRLVEDDGLRDRVGKAARDRAAGWTIQEHAHEWVGAYRGAME